MNLMRVYYLYQNWLQTTQKLLKLIANRQMDSYWRGKMVRGTARLRPTTRTVSCARKAPTTWARNAVSGSKAPEGALRSRPVTYDPCPPDLEDGN